MDNLMYLIVMWVAAILFIIIGIYAMNRKKPMWLWSGSQISESNINDVKAYNRAIGKMWCVFSIPMFVGGIYFTNFFDFNFSADLYCGDRFRCLVLS